jgi:hypothetical protein
MKIAAEQVQDSCHRVRESAKPHAYLNPAVEGVGRVRELELPAARPIIVPKRYGDGLGKDYSGYTGLAVINDGEPAYDVTISNISLKDDAKLEFHSGHTERLAKTDGEAFYPAFVGMKLGGTFRSGLFDFMRERGVQRLTVPITYRDSANNWFQTDVTLERDVEKSGGLRLGWTQADSRSYLGSNIDLSGFIFDCDRASPSHDAQCQISFVGDDRGQELEANRPCETGEHRRR